MITEHFFNTPEECFRATAQKIACSLQDALTNRKSAQLVVCGGNSARGVLPLLAAELVDWERIIISLADERCVPINHEDRNDRLVEKCFSQAGIKLSGLQKLADDFGNVIQKEVGPPFFDMVFLGMGEDGHIASLFPGSKVLQESSKGVVSTNAPQGIRKRLSLTPNSILQSKKIVLVIAGEKKGAVYDEVRKSGPIAEYPVRLLLQQKKVPVDIFLA